MHIHPGRHAPKCNFCISELPRSKSHCPTKVANGSSTFARGSGALLCTHSNNNTCMLVSGCSLLLTLHRRMDVRGFELTWSASMAFFSYLSHTRGCLSLMLVNRELAACKVRCSRGEPPPAPMRLRMSSTVYVGTHACCMHAHLCAHSIE